jgi:hypothetical protein
MSRRLAVLQKRPVESREFAANREADSFHPALLRCSLHACRLGLTSEATHLLEQCSPRRYDYWALRDHWHTSYILPWLLTIAVKIVVENRSLTLFDCLPLELWQLVQDEPVPETEEAQKKLLLAKLREEPTDEQRKTEKNTKVKLGASEKYHAPDTVSTRIVPTVRLAERIAALLSARSASNRHAAAIEYFDAWRAAQDSSERDIHSSRELGRFINDLYVTGALRVFGTIGLMNAETALRLEECLNDCEFVSAHDRIRFVGMLSAYPDCHVHAGRMGVEAVKAIEREDEITQRAGLLADLARAILPADRSEAAILFKHGLTELDAIGSGDWQFTNELLSFAAEDSWEDWLSKYRLIRTDGLWTSDGTGRYPLRACHDLLDENAKEAVPTGDQRILLSLVGIDSIRAIGTSLVVSGSWNSPDRVRVAISSTLVPHNTAELAARALSTSPPFHMWLPSKRAFGDDDDDHESSEYDPCAAWISRKEAYVKIDEFDPYGSKAALERSRLTRDIILKFGLSSTDPWLAEWKRPNELSAFSADAWGIRSGFGERELA